MVNEHQPPSHPSESSQGTTHDDGASRGHGELPELTLRAVLLGVLLSVILGAANAYLGLFAGMTVSASIPAAVISMGVLRWFRRANVLENNIVQTAASAGESLAAGVIFTIPALLIMGVWNHIHYWETTLISLCGGLLGVLFTIPLRRPLVVESSLRFPEGTATAAVLQAGHGGEGIGQIVAGALAGGLFKLGEAGFHVYRGALEAAARWRGAVLYAGASLSPALLAVGYIVGFNVAVLVLLGGLLNWYLLIPLLSGFSGADATPALDQGWRLWSTQTRYVGVGAMVVGGLWALVQLRGSLLAALRSGVRAYRRLQDDPSHLAPRTERDAPVRWVLACIVVFVVFLFLIFHHITRSVGIAAVMAVLMLVTAFLFTAVAAYMAGLVGSSNNPVSGVTIATILVSSVTLLFLAGTQGYPGPAAAILIGAVTCCAAAIGGDNTQDLKAGHLVGATPYRQQIMQSVGVAAAAFVVAPVVNLLNQAYGIGLPTPAHPHPLQAPQSTLMAEVATGVFHGSLPWGMVLVGVVLSVLVIAVDVQLARRGCSFRAPVLAVAVGIYLPLQLSVPIAVGGWIAWSASRWRKGGRNRSDAADSSSTGTMLAAGLITGEALVGILIAIPIVVTGRPDPFPSLPLSWPWMGVAMFVLVSLWLWNSGRTLSPEGD